MICNTIEDIIIQKDKRGIATYRSFLPKNYCSVAAKAILKQKQTVLITSGFYIKDANAPETDGPQGSILLGNVLKLLGHTVYYITDIYSEHLFKTLVNKRDLIIFPLLDEIKSEVFAQQIIAKYEPGMLISIERCGLTEQNTYKNMRGVDISNYNARIDHLFMNHTNTIGIGDGGNEIGMGNLAPMMDGSALVKDPCITPVDHLIIATTSNWGVYGLLAALSIETKKQLLPSKIKAKNLLQKLVKLGAVDGITKKNTISVDGFSVKEDGEILEQLKSLVNV